MKGRLIGKSSSGHWIMSRTKSDESMNPANSPFVYFVLILLVIEISEVILGMLF
jgi:hypothetical protein